MVDMVADKAVPASLEAPHPQPLNPLRVMARLSPRHDIVRDGGGMPQSLGRIGTLEVRLARTRQDIRRAQRLRFKVFFKEMSATPDARAFVSRRDIDPYDRICDHLIVIDHAGKISRFGKVRPKVVGTYRLLRGDVAAAHGSDFYTAGEYDLAPMLAAFSGARMLELGRSCVLKPYRGKRIVDLLWQGLLAYIRHHRVELVFGCASFEGVAPRQHAEALAFLHHTALMPEAGRVKAHPWNNVPMHGLEKDTLDIKRALKALPPLIKGYMRLGARFGEGAVIDRAFGTTDVFVMMRVDAIDARYLNHYGDMAGDPAISASMPSLKLGQTNS